MMTRKQFREKYCSWRLEDPQIDETVEDFAEKGYGFVDKFGQKMRVEKPDCICQQLHTDEHGIVQPHKCYCTVDVQIWYDYSQPNRDIPDRLHNIAQGQAHPVNGHLDAKEEIRGWHARGLDSDFRDRCVQMTDPTGKIRNYALYLKSKVDIKPTGLKDFKWVAGRLGCEEDVAIKLVAVLAELSMSWQQAVRFFPELKSFNREEKACLLEDKMAYVLRDRPIPERIDWLEKLAAEIKEPDWKTIDDTWHVGADHSSRIDNWEYLTDEVLEALRYVPYSEDSDYEDPFWEYLEPDEEPFKEDELDVRGDNNPFSAFPLYDGSEALHEDIIEYIRDCDEKTLKQISKWLYNRGRHLPSKLWWLTDGQVNQMWPYINEKKEQIKETKVLKISVACAEIIELVRSWGKIRSSSSLIYAFKDGRSYDFFGEIINAQKAKASADDLSALWAVYNQL